MEYSQEFDVKQKHSSLDSFQTWRQPCESVENPKRTLPLTPERSKYYEADAMRKTNQIIVKGGLFFAGVTFAALVLELFSHKPQVGTVWSWSGDEAQKLLEFFAVAVKLVVAVLAGQLLAVALRVCLERNKMMMYHWFGIYSFQSLLFTNGIVGIKDLVRPCAKKSVAVSRSTGIAVRMVTGDSINTAKAIAREYGIEGPDFRPYSRELLELNIPILVPLQPTVIVYALVVYFSSACLTGSASLTAVQLCWAPVIAHLFASIIDGVNTDTDLFNSRQKIYPINRFAESNAWSFWIFMSEAFQGMTQGARDGLRILANILLAVFVTATSDYLRSLIHFIEMLLHYRHLFFSFLILSPFQNIITVRASRPPPFVTPPLSAPNFNPPPSLLRYTPVYIPNLYPPPLPQNTPVYTGKHSISWTSPEIVIPILSMILALISTGVICYCCHCHCEVCNNKAEATTDDGTTRVSVEN